MTLSSLRNLLFGTLRRQLIFSVAAVHAVMMTMFIWDLTVRQEAKLLEQQTRLATALAQNLATSAAGWTAASDVAGLQEIVNSLKRYPELEYALVTNQEGKILAHSDRRHLGQFMLDLPDPAKLKVITDVEDLIDVVNPIKVANQQVGWVRVGLGQQTLRAQMRDILRDGVLYALTATLIGAMLAAAMASRVTRRLKAIESVADEIGHGNRQARVSTTGNDELCAVATQFNAMLDTVVEHERELISSHQALHAREVQLQHVMTATGEGIWDWDMITNTVHHNQRWCTLLGLGGEFLEHPLDRFKQYIHQDDRALVRMRIEQCLAGHGPYRSEHRLVRASDGKVIWVQDRGDVAEFDAEGMPIRMLGSIADITDRVEAEAATRQALATLDATEDAAFIFAPDTLRFSYVNEGAIRQVGYTRQELLTMTPLDIKTDVNEPRFREMLAPLLRGDISTLRFTTEHRHKNGHTTPVEINLQYIQPAGEPARLIALVRDISERLEADLALKQSEARLRAIVNVAPVPFVLYDDADNITLVNAAFVDTFGYRLEDIPTIQAWETKAYPNPSYRQIAIRLWQTHEDLLSRHETSGDALELKVVCKDGSSKTVLANSAALTGPLADTHVVVLYDITERKRSEQLIWQQANFDTLTHLPNRAMLQDRLSQEMKRSDRTLKPMALLLIDLDQFKEVNDVLGHEAGDQLLQQAAQRLSNCVRTTDMVARLGGDEFTVIISEATNTSDLDLIAQKIIDELAAPVHLGAETVHVSASIGISLYPSDAATADALMKSADQAMYAAKRLGRNRYNYFTPTMQQAARERLRLSNDLRRALEQNEFVLHYQPQIDLISNRVTGIEALIRWQHPMQGLVSPMVFIPIAEDNGLIAPIGEWVMNEACAQLRQWRDIGLTDIRMSVNLSARQLRQKSLPNTIARILEQHAVPASMFEMEITESLAMENRLETARTMTNLRDVGVMLAIDDFGTGHSSLSYLKNFPVNRVKLDRSFIQNIEDEPSDAVIVSSTISLAHNLGLEVVAEGVESVRQVEYLGRLRCDVIQGYYYSKPLPAEQAEQFIRHYNMSTPPTATPQRPCNILVIDDDESVAQYIHQVLLSLGHQPITETDPTKAVTLMQQAPERFDMIFSDLVMPGLSGMELVKAIREVNSEVPIILITAYQRDAVIRNFKAMEKTCHLLAGINYFVLEKPVLPSGIKDIMSRLAQGPAITRPNTLSNGCRD